MKTKLQHPIDSLNEAWPERGIKGFSRCFFSLEFLVNYYGLVNLTAGYYNVPSLNPIGSRSVLTAFVGGTPNEKGAEYFSASPLNSVRHDLPPSLLIYGRRDYILTSKSGKGLAQGALCGKCRGLYPNQDDIQNVSAY